MNAVKFHTVIGPDQVIRPPKDVQLAPGQAEVIVLQPDSRPDETTPPVVPRKHLFDRLAGAAEELGIDPKDLPTDLAENHDHYAHGAPKGLDQT